METEKIIRLDFEFAASTESLRGIVDSLIYSDSGRKAVLLALSKDYEDDLLDFIREEYFAGDIFFDAE